MVIKVRWEPSSMMALAVMTPFWVTTDIIAVFSTQISTGSTTVLADRREEGDWLLMVVVDVVNPETTVSNLAPWRLEWCFALHVRQMFFDRQSLTWWFVFKQFRHILFFITSFILSSGVGYLVHWKVKCSPRQYLQLALVALLKKDVVWCGNLDDWNGRHETVSPNFSVVHLGVCPAKYTQGGRHTSRTLCRDSLVLERKIQASRKMSEENDECFRVLAIHIALSCTPLWF